MKHNFIADSQLLATQLISQNVAGVSKAAINALLNQGEVRLNGTKIFADCKANKGDQISIFVPKKYVAAATPKIIYRDENIVLVDKPPLFDVENNLLSFVKESYPSAQAVHRLDRNTRGLVIFALNDAAFNELNQAFKRRAIDKFYYALVAGNCTLNGTFNAFLIKDSDKSEVKILKTEAKGSKKISTQIKRATKMGSNTLLEIKLITGRTHQIRAHLSFLGYPIIGDGKYGNNKKGEIQLFAYKIAFISMENTLKYLNGKEFKIAIKFID